MFNVSPNGNAKASISSTFNIATSDTISLLINLALLFLPLLYSIEISPFISTICEFVRRYPSSEKNPVPTISASSILLITLMTFSLTKSKGSFAFIMSIFCI